MTDKEPQEHKIVIYLYKDIDQGELFVEINEVLCKHFKTDDIVVFFEKPDAEEKGKRQKDLAEYKWYKEIYRRVQDSKENPHKSRALQEILGEEGYKEFLEMPDDIPDSELFEMEDEE